MTDVHVISGDLDGQYQIVMHFPVPGGNNTAGVSWQTALLNSGIGLHETGRRTVLPSGAGTGGTISVAEEAALNAGTLFETVVQYRADTGPSLANIDALYTQSLANAQAQLSRRLKYFGLTRTVP